LAFAGTKGQKPKEEGGGWRYLGKPVGSGEEVNYFSLMRSENHAEKIAQFSEE
jgi:hypothetical protein